MIKDVAKGTFGAISAGGTLWVSIEQALSPLLRLFVLIMGAFVVWATWKGILLSNRQKDLDLLIKKAEAETAERKLCEECRSGKPPAHCPFPLSRRPRDCPNPNTPPPY